MSESIIDLWPSHVDTPDHGYGDTENRVRSFLWRREDGTLRFVVIDAQGVILDRTDVSEYVNNGAGIELTTPDGTQWIATPVPGCPTCGGGNSAGIVHQLLRGQGDE